MSDALDVIAIIPVRGRDVSGGMPLLNGKPLLAYTIEAAQRSRLITRLVVSTDSLEVQRLAIALGAEAPFLRPAELCEPGIPIERVLQHALRWFDEQRGCHPDLVVQLEMTHPFREEGLIDRVIRTLTTQPLDTVFTVYVERHNFWVVGPDGALEPVGGTHHTRAQRPPVYREVSGLVCATRASVVRRGERLGERVGVVALTSLQALVDTQDAQGLELAERLLKGPV